MNLGQTYGTVIRLISDKCTRCGIFSGEFERRSEVRRITMFIGTGLLAALWLHGAQAQEIKSKKGGIAAQVVAGKAPDKVCTSGTCNGDYGTSVHFEPTPSAAAK